MIRLACIYPPSEQEDDEDQASQNGSRDSNRNLERMDEQAGDDVTDQEEQPPAECNGSGILFQVIPFEETDHIGDDQPYEGNRPDTYQNQTTENSYQHQSDLHGCLIADA